MQKIDKQKKVERARDLFLSGFNCAQSVFIAYAPEMGMDEKLAAKVSSGMGGGMGGMRGVCGVCGGLSAAFMVMGALNGYDEASDLEGKKRLYAREQAMANVFVEQFEDVHCRKLLLRHGIVASNVPSERTPEYYQKRPCARYVEACAGILADALNEDITACK